jgi:hypothetical protein
VCYTVAPAYVNGHTFNMFVNKLRPDPEVFQVPMDTPIRNTWKERVSCIQSVYSSHPFEMILTNELGGFTTRVCSSVLKTKDVYRIVFPTSFPLGLLCRTMVQFRGKGECVEIVNTKYPLDVHGAMISGKTYHVMINGRALIFRNGMCAWNYV